MVIFHGKMLVHQRDNGPKFMCNTVQGRQDNHQAASQNAMDRRDVIILQTQLLGKKNHTPQDPRLGALLGNPVNPPFFLIPWFILEKTHQFFWNMTAGSPTGRQAPGPSPLLKAMPSDLRLVGLRPGAWGCWDVEMLGAELGRNWNVSEDVRICWNQLSKR